MFFALMVAQLSGAALVVNGTPDPNWLGLSAIGNTTESNDFWFTFLTHNSIEKNNSSLNLTLHIVAEDSVSVMMEVNGRFTGPYTIPSGGGAGSWPINAIDAYISGDESENILPRRGIHVYSTDPHALFSCYALAEAGIGQGTTRDAALILPTQTLGREYFVQTYQTDTRATEFAVVVTEDNTDITIIPNAKTSKNTLAGQPITLTGLAKGTVYEVRSADPAVVAPSEKIDLSGSSVCATKPVAVFQGNEAVKIASGSVGSYSVNYAYEQTLPVAQWGTEFYLGITKHAYYNYYNILAAYDNTTVTVSGQQPLVLNAGETLDEAQSLYYISESLKSTDVKITADKPVLVTPYLSCGGANHNAAELINGRPIPTNWGNSTAAMMPSWETRVKHMSFFTDTISNETASGVGHMYVQVVTKTADAGSFTLDGIALSPDTFKTMSADGLMAIANIELSGEGLHTLETTGDGFVGFVYAITSEARAYQYTLGFAPKRYDDSLYIETPDAAMTGGYNLERVEGKGWYQRQLNEWIESRLDTASVCDSTQVQWRIDSPADTLFRVDSIHWVITNADTLVFEKDTIIPRGHTVHRWDFTFALPDEVKEARITHLDYKVQAHLFRTPLFCDYLPVDTLQGFVRVHTLYNDTTWMVVCEGDPDIGFFTDSTITTDHLGADTITRSYVSAGGCDSLSTLVLYVCHSVYNTLDTTLCEKELAGLNLGYYFRDINFVTSFEARNTSSLWTQDAQGYWIFEQADTLKPASCKDEVEDFIRHGAVYNGCDSALHLHLRVLSTVVKRSDISLCSTSYEWTDDANHPIQTINKTAENYNKPCSYTYSIPYQDGDCDSVRYELTLTFVDGALATDTIRLCRNDAPVTPSHNGVIWDTFDPSAHEPGKYEGDTKWFSAQGDCSNYPFQFIFYVEPLPAYRDTVVYCYEDIPSRLHQWSGHDSFWYKEKGSSVVTRAGNFTATYPSLSEGRKIYELSDTVRSTVDGACDEAYYQVVIFMPRYDMHWDKHIADVHTYEWNGKLLVGEEVDTDTVQNPKGLEMVVMKPVGGVYPTGWIVTYDPVLRTYSITDSILTRAIRNDAGEVQQCDSVISLSLHVGQIFRDTSFSYSPSNKEFKWRDKDLALPQVTEPTEVFFYDSLKTKWPVIGLDSIYTLSLTVFPSYSLDTAVAVCQDSLGFDWPRHRVVEIDEPGQRTIYDSLKTAPQIYTHPKTKEQTIVICDSIWALDLTVNTVYNADYTFIRFADGLKSNDTLTFFSPKTLFIGEDFDYASHGGKTAEELRIEAGADAVEIVSHDSLYAKTASLSTGCDSTTYLQLALCRLVTTTLIDTIGDNDTLWVFGGDITEQHTQPFVYGRDFHTDDNGNPIDYSSLDRSVRVKEFVDTLPSAKGCDSIVHMTLRIFPSYRLEETATICGNNADFTWHGKTHLNKLVGDNETGVVYVYDSLLSVRSNYHADSVHVLELTIYPGEWTRTTRTLCYNDTILWHGLQLQYNPDEHIDEVVHEFKDESSECGRVIYMTPVFNPSYGYGGAPDYNNWVESVRLCQHEDFTWRGKQISTAHVGDFTVYDSLKTVGCGCDSIYTLNYHVDTTYRYFTEDRICTSRNYDWYVNGNLYKSYTPTTTEDLYDTIKGYSVLGCDSSYYLHLKVDSTYHIHIDETLCPNEINTFSWNGLSYDQQLSDARNWEEPREFFDTLRTVSVVTGCDSTRYLHLTILPAQDSVWTDSICEGESYDFFGRTLTTTGTYIQARPNRFGCTIDYKLTLEVIPPTRFTVTAEPLCFDPAATNSYPLYYTYTGSFAPVSYSIYYGEEAKAIGFQDVSGLAIPPSQTGMPLDIEVPYFEPLDYPAPGDYPAVVGFENGLCDGDSLMRIPFVMHIHYPSWIMEQRHNDLIALLNEDYNGGYKWSGYQWYEGDSMLVGQTKPYLYIPTGLKVGTEYYVSLTREGETQAYASCPIIVQSGSTGNDNTPTMGYLSVTPTCVLTGNPLVNILSRKDGTYRVTSSGGRLVTQGVFRAPVTPLTLPTVAGMYVIQLWSNDTPEEPYRAIKVIVSQSCPNCDISSF